MSINITPKQYRTIGGYLIVLLSLVRFVVYPLNGAVDGKKAIFDDVNETWRLKRQLFQKQEVNLHERGSLKIDEKAIVPSVNKKEMPYSSIQADILDNIIKIVEKRGLSVQSFEMLEPAAGKRISEVPVLIRILGEPLELLAVIKLIVVNEKAMMVDTLEINRYNQSYLLTMRIIAFRMEW
jgi:hypothetical protein